MTKVISQQNWLEPDDATKVFARISPATGAVEPTVGQDWLNDFIEPKLQESVPPDVQALFELARGAMVYGYFYYPLYYLGFMELARVAEAAAHHKCKVEEKPAEPGKDYDHLYDKIKWLIDNGHIPQVDAEWWTSMRRYRNFVSHPTDAGVILPTMARDALERTAEKINALFPAQGS